MSDTHFVAKHIGLKLFVAVLGLLVAGAQLGQAQTESVLYTFCTLPQCADGSAPDGNLLFDAQGNLYGTTSGGGAHQSGTAFKLTASGTETVLHSFGAYGGAYPEGSLIWDAKGNLYGTTLGSSYIGLLGSKYFGSVFELEKKSESVRYLHSFTENNEANGAVPTSGLVMDEEGNLYGTTRYGGAYPCGDGYGCGTVFKVTPGGTYTVLHNFTGGTDGEQPNGGLILDGDGNLYGTTDFGGGAGTGCGISSYCGTVFKVTSDGTETLLYSFTGGADGGRPLAGLVMDSQGNVYGTTDEGGTASKCSIGCGTVFKVTPGGTESVLYSFTAGKDGLGPQAGLTRDGQGNLYGTTFFGGGSGCTGDAGCGTVFVVTPDGTETVLYRFTGGTDGGRPYGGLVQDAQGNLYGTTYMGGTGECDGLSGCGVVFRVTP